jgi:hypothetical protein
VLLTSQALVNLSSHFFIHSSEIQQLVDAHLILDTLVQELYQAPKNIEYWQVLQPNHVSFTINNKLLSWQNNKGTLIRRVKKRNSITNAWRRGKSTILLPSASKLFVVEKKLNEYESIIEVQLTYHNHRVTRLVVPRGA